MILLARNEVCDSCADRDDCICVPCIGGGSEAAVISIQPILKPNNSSVTVWIDACIQGCLYRRDGLGWKCGYVWRYRGHCETDFRRKRTTCQSRIDGLHCPIICGTAR